MTSRLCWLGLLLALGLTGCSERQPERSGKAKTDLEVVPSPLVRVGLEVLADDGLNLLDGKRLGLVVHAASQTHEGEHAIDVLSQRGYTVSKLFSPEHGLRGRAEAGETVASGHDETTGLPVISLYGERRQPSAEDLADLDALVFDLQGAGVRFYTYVSTMILCLEAAADAGIEFVVLDRPNPLGGERIEGPVSAPRDVVASSFVNLAPGPLIHGLTMGEMARLVQNQRFPDLSLTIVQMEGWRRAMTWSDTGRPWISPSPNLRSPEAALAYPGVALLEATNASEGRGTSKPFLLLGAPWVSASSRELEPPQAPGFELHVSEFVPAEGGKNGGRECLGWRVEITEAAAVQPYRLGLELLTHLSQQDGFEWLRDGEALTWLLGTPLVFEALATDQSRDESQVDEILALDDEAHRAWRQERLSALLYD